MTFQMLAIGLGKQSFHLHGIDDDGKVSRAKLAPAIADLNPAVIAMEASASAHHWGRCFEADGRQVRLINPRFVKPFVRGSKNDAVDAEAIYDAASRPTMRFVRVKSVEQQDLQSLHRIRERLIVQRTSLINHADGAAFRDVAEGSRGVRCTPAGMQRTEPPPVRSSEPREAKGQARHLPTGPCSRIGAPGLPC